MAVAAVLENIVPPMPSDVIIALAAFLSHRGATSGTTVFLVAWAGSVAGAGIVYLLARRLGPRLFATRLGRRLVTPEAVVRVERGYLRFGLPGVLVARLLPGFRAFTAPFLGLMRIGPVRAFLPVALASGAWYGAVTYFAARLGRDWASVTRFLEGLNRTAGVLAVLLAAGLVVVWLRHRRRRAAAPRLRDEEAAALAPYPTLEHRIIDDPALAALVGLLVETEEAGDRFSPEELQRLEQHLRSRLLSTEDRGRMDGEEAQRLLSRLGPAQRAGLAGRIREAVFGDEALRRHEQDVMARVAALLGLP